MRWRVIRTIAVREWRAALAARWFWVYAALLTLLGAGLLWMSAGLLPAGIPATVANGRVLMATVNLLGLLVPLMGLTAGAQSLARERDRRTLTYLLAQPITRSELLTGKLAGNAVALGSALGAATALLILVAALFSVPLGATVLLAVAGLGWLLALASLALGMALGAGAASLVAVQGATLAAWLLLALLGDLGMMGLLLLRQLPAQALLVLTFLNPVHQFRVAAVSLFRPALDVLGPVGQYAEARFGSSLVPLLLLSLTAWAFGVTLVALERFRKSRVL